MSLSSCRWPSPDDKKAKLKFRIKVRTYFETMVLNLDFISLLLSRHFYKAFFSVLKPIYYIAGETFYYRIWTLVSEGVL